MGNKKNIQNMTSEELVAYVETVRERNRVNSKKHYDQKIKTDPEKYAKFLEKCKAPNLKYYYTKQMRIEDELSGNFKKNIIIYIEIIKLIFYKLIL
jgi:DNA-directed RNA polymerase subunit M/transcription elongation factor TFIIS